MKKEQVQLTVAVAALNDGHEDYDYDDNNVDKILNTADLARNGWFS